jgi:stage V sporulation protein D (sporulation-specific penicillin-binding protein)
MNYPNIQEKKSRHINRVQLLKIALVIFGVILISRLFYVQIIRHDHYQSQALAEHIKKFEISASRGTIYFQDGSETVPVVLNEKRYTIYADPKYISNTEETADKLIGLIGGDKEDLKAKLETTNSRYVILAKKMTKEQAERIDALGLKGIGEKEVSIRTYPQGSLAAHLLGFVNDDGQGQYGVEEYLNDQLAGKSGLEKAVTDIRGVPLAVNNDNILLQPEPGEDLALTIDIGMQKMVEDIIKSGVDRIGSIRGSVVIMEANTGAIKAMANYPVYEPANYSQITDQSIFINTAVSMPWEPGSVMKPLVVSAALSEGAATPETSYYDPGYVKIADRTITNSTPWAPQTTSVRDVINNSLNTGAVFVEKTLGGGQINDQARQIWYDYLVNHYNFNQKTGVEQAGEAAGFVNGPFEGYGLEVRYANMAFGQGVTVTPIQLVGAYAAIVNGGTYYRPTLISARSDDGSVANQTPEVLKENVISDTASSQIRDMLKTSLEINNKPAIRAGYALGAKSGTAQVADDNGNYKEDAYNGAYIGYIGGADGPKYIMLVRVDEPKTGGFASTQAYIIWDEISNKLIDSFAIRPISN